MTTSIQSRRTGAIVVSAALVAALAVSTLAVPVSAAKPKCMGKTATIVGTNHNEVIRGTRKADVIVSKRGNDKIYGRGGNDVICGGPGNDVIYAGPGIDRALGGTGKDRLYGGPGPDRLFGGPANDKLDGGIGRDACFGGTGGGPRLNCELPAPPAPAPTAKTMVIAYSDLNGDHAYGAGDVLVSKIMDSNFDGRVSPGDSIVMGMYPTTVTPSTPAHFAYWGRKSHTVSAVNSDVHDGSERYLGVSSTADWSHTWYEAVPGGAAEYDSYYEYANAAAQGSYLVDHLDSGDYIDLHTQSPSQPVTTGYLPGAVTGDAGFVDVDFHY